MIAPQEIMRLMLIILIALLLVTIIFSTSASAGEAASQSCSAMAGRISDITGGVTIC